MIILISRIFGGEGCLLIRNRDGDCNKCPPAGPDNGKGSAKRYFISMASPILTQSCKISEQILGVEVGCARGLDFGGEGCLLIRNRDRDCNKCPPAGPDNGKGSAKRRFISMASPILT